MTSRRFKARHGIVTDSVTGNHVPLPDDAKERLQEGPVDDRLYERLKREAGKWAKTLNEGMDEEDDS